MTKKEQILSTKKKPSGASARILSTLAFMLQTQKVVDVPKKQIRALCNISEKSLPPLLSRLKTSGCIEHTSKDTIKITDHGFTMVDSSDLKGCRLAKTNQEIMEEIKERKLKGLGKKAGHIFDMLADGKAHEKSEIMDVVNIPNKSTFAPLLSRIKATGVLEYPSKSSVQLTDECFPFGRP